MAACGSEPSEEEEKESEKAYNNLDAIQRAYFTCIDKTGKPPSGPEHLATFFAAEVDQSSVYQSARDGQPYVIAWGVYPRRHRGEQQLAVVFEKIGKDGRRIVLTNFGVQEMDEEQFRACSFPPGIKP